MGLIWLGFRAWNHEDIIVLLPTLQRSFCITASDHSWEPEASAMELKGLYSRTKDWGSSFRCTMFYTKWWDWLKCSITWWLLQFPIRRKFGCVQLHQVSYLVRPFNRVTSLGAFFFWQVHLEAGVEEDLNGRWKMRCRVRAWSCDPVVFNLS